MTKVSFIISYFISELLKWAATLRKNNDPILNSLEDFLRKLRRNFGDPELEAFVANGKFDNILQRKYGRIFELITDVLTIENLTKRNRISEYYIRNHYNEANSSNNHRIQNNDPMDVDLYRIRDGMTVEVLDISHPMKNCILIKKIIMKKKEIKAFAFFVINQGIYNSTAQIESALEM
eukprot:jgi/Orpsp1_1/1180315/evm.model.c7180000072896.1